MINEKSKTTIKNMLASIMGTIPIVIIHERSFIHIIPNVFIIIISFLFLFLLYKNKTLCNRKENSFAIVFSIFLSIIFIIGDELDTFSNILWSFKTLLLIFLMFFTFYGPTRFVINFINTHKTTEHININKKVTFFVIWIFNMLVFLAVYPGIYAYDAGFQIMEVLNDNVQLNNHFSLLSSYLMANFVNIGIKCFNSSQIGLAFFTFFQLSVMSYIATRITFYSYYISKNKSIYYLCLIFFSLFPMYTVMTVSTAQDTLFAGIFAITVINLIEQNKKPNNLKIAFKLFILMFLLCILRNNGYYAILCLIVFQLFNRNYRLFKIIPIVLAIFCYKLCIGPFYDYLNVYKEPPIREMSSIPSQQLARVYNYNKKILSKKQLNQYKKYYYKLSDFKYYTHRQSISDPTKGVLDVDKTQNNMRNYIKFWAKIGLEDPENYVEAFLLNNLGAWYPYKEFPDERMYHPYIEYKMMDAKKWNKDYIDIKKDSKFRAYDLILCLLVDYSAWKCLPIIRFVFEVGSYFVVLIFTIGYVILYKRKEFLVPLLLVLAFYGTVLLAPVSLFRYSFPIVIILPIYISILFSKESEWKLD